jgi:hypothetical protein
MMLTTSTMRSELQMKNQSSLPRYASQRDAHSMSLSSQCTSYLHGRTQSAARTHSRACPPRYAAGLPGYDVAGQGQWHRMHVSLMLQCTLAAHLASDGHTACMGSVHI